jgi:hypothetical protein
VTARPPLVVRALNTALGLELASFTEARVFLRSPEGHALLEEWLAAHLEDSEDGEQSA